MLGHLWQMILDGVMYDILKAVFISLVGSAALTFLIKKISDKIQGKRDIIITGFIIWFVAFMAVMLVIPTRQAPNLVAGIQNVIIGEGPNKTSAIGMITMSIVNSGNMQTVGYVSAVEVKIGDQSYTAGFPVMPENITFYLPNLGESSPASVTYKKEDDLREKSQNVIPPGGLVTGTIFIFVPNISAESLKNGSELTVYIVDAFSRKYTASTKITPQFALIGKTPGLHSDLACRAAPGGLGGVPNVELELPHSQAQSGEPAQKKN